MPDGTTGRWKLNRTTVLPITVALACRWGGHSVLKRTCLPKGAPGLRTDHGSVCPIPRYAGISCHEVAGRECWSGGVGICAERFPGKWHTTNSGRDVGRLSAEYTMSRIVPTQPLTIPAATQGLVVNMTQAPRSYRPVARCCQ